MLTTKSLRFITKFTNKAAIPNTTGIPITIEITGNSLSFTCTNYFDESKVFTREKSGMGIDMIRQRLQLLYRDRHELEIVRNENQFVVRLKIETI